MEYNIFSYIQLIARFYNIEKKEGVLKRIEENLKYIARQRVRKPNRKLIETHEELRNILRYFIGPELRHFINKLDSFLSNPASFDSRGTRNLSYEAKALGDPRHALEIAVKAAKDYAERATRRCRRLIDKLERGYSRVGYRVARFDAKLLERALFGASQRFGKLLFEISLEFDPYLNVPIIPGSSIKGALRATYEYVSGPTSAVFGEGGEHARAGLLIFSDAYPVEPGREGMVLFPDVLTPHYSKKEGEDILEEWEWEPRPIPYLSVAPGTTFGFVVASRRNEIPEEEFTRVIKTAFSLGLGGKTCVGYGRLALKIDRVTFKM